MLKKLFSQNRELSKHSKKVKQWQSEHRNLAKYATKILRYLDMGEEKKAKKAFRRLHEDALHHLMDEDITFYNLLQKVEQQKIEKDEKIMDCINKFRDTFSHTKQALFDFFEAYEDKSRSFDNRFRKEFEGIVEALVSRIEYEESNLYQMINQ